MAQNPLLGKRISLISKKNIRYEGLLYSINEQNATVALQNVRSYGTEGRELDNEGKPLVGPSEDVHPYLLFRGQDIKDLHVHDETPQGVPPPQPPPPQPPVVPLDSIIGSETTSLSQINTTIDQIPQTSDDAPPGQQPETNKLKSDDAPIHVEESDGEAAEESQQQNVGKPRDDSTKRPKQPGGRGGGRGPKNKRRTNERSGADPAAIGTGASLLGRKARGVVKDSDINPAEEFDFQSNLLQLQKQEQKENDKAGDVTGSNPNIQSSTPAATVYYTKDNFFDSISCDALDKEQGVDNRLRGSAERLLNTETFGAVALNANNSGYRGRGRRGGGSGTGRGYSGRGRSRGEGSGNNANYGRGGRSDGGGRDGGRGRVSTRGRGRGGRGRGSGRGRQVAVSE